MSIPKSLAFSYCLSEEVADGLWYCEQKNLYWKDNTIYCEESARHNGLIGEGAVLKNIIVKQPE